MNYLQLLGALELGLIYSFVTIGIYLTFRVIDFPDLTVDGSFTLGAAVSASLAASGFCSEVSLIFAIISGALAGAISGYLNAKWNILGLLAGIITMTALYSINIKIMGKPNIAISNDLSFFTSNYLLLKLTLLILILIILLSKFFSSDFGLGIRAIGINPKVSTAYGINVNSMKIVALSLSNAIVALAGALFAQINGFADINMGTGTIIYGLAAVILGESLISNKTIFLALIGCVAGSIVYRIILTLALGIQPLGIEPSDLNLITSALLAIILILKKKNITI